jgi:ElaB/YqjD/DUF883 family membrane-anchored ribosome-binding protein
MVPPPASGSLERARLQEAQHSKTRVPRYIVRIDKPGHDRCCRALAARAPLLTTFSMTNPWQLAKCAEEVQKILREMDSCQDETGAIADAELKEFTAKLQKARDHIRARIRSFNKSFRLKITKGCSSSTGATVIALD